MTISRRWLLSQLGRGAVLNAVAPAVAHASSGTRWDMPAAGGRPVSLRLNRNENAFGPSESVVAVLRDAARRACRYPDVESDRLRDAIARAHAVTRDEVVVGCGSEEIFRMAAHAFLGSGKTLVTADPGYDAVARHARSVGAEVIAVPLSASYSSDLSAMLAGCDARTGLVYICNPHNPTGTITSRHDLDAFVQKLPATTTVLIDEAYHHYVIETPEYVSYIDRPRDHGRVIITRTFSKIYALAGLRVGYAVAAPQTAAQLARHRLESGVNAAAATAARAALSDTDHVRRSMMRTVDLRQEFLNQANARMLRSIDSQVNFVMLNTERPASEVVDHFRKHNVLIAGPFARLDTYVRVSLGTSAEMNEFWRVWDLMPMKMAM